MNNNVIKFPAVVQPQTITVPKVPSLVRNMACALMVNLRINCSASLIYLLGTGAEKSNQEAIEAWLLREYGPDMISTLQDPTEKLSNALMTYLNDQLIDREEL